MVEIEICFNFLCACLNSFPTCKNLEMEKGRKSWRIYTQKKNEEVRLMQEIVEEGDSHLRTSIFCSNAFQYEIECMAMLGILWMSFCDLNMLNCDLTFVYLWPKTRLYNPPLVVHFCLFNCSTMSKVVYGNVGHDVNGFFVT